MNNFNYKNMTPFKWFVLENFPFIENDFEAINNYRLFSKVVEYLNKMKDNVNLTGQQMENLTNAMIELQNYVNNYFDNLDVQEEINNKLDEMAENGTLETIIGKYINNKPSGNTFSLRRIGRKIFYGTAPESSDYNENGSPAGIQGGCMINSNTIAFMLWDSLNPNLNENRVIIMNINTGVIQQTADFNFGWCNSIAYNNGLLYVAVRGTTTNDVAQNNGIIKVIDVNTLQVVNEITLPINVNSISILNDTIYALEDLGSNIIHLYNLDGTQKDEIITLKYDISDIYNQNIKVTENYIYLISTRPSNLLSVYDITGNHIKSYNVPKYGGLYRIGELQIIDTLDGHNMLLASVVNNDEEFINQFFKFNLVENISTINFDERYAQTYEVDSDVDNYNPDGTTNNKFTTLNEIDNIFTPNTVINGNNKDYGATYLSDHKQMIIRNANFPKGIRMQFGNYQLSNSIVGFSKYLTSINACMFIRDAFAVLEGITFNAENNQYCINSQRNNIIKFSAPKFNNYTTAVFMQNQASSIIEINSLDNIPFIPRVWNKVYNMMSNGWINQYKSGNVNYNTNLSEEEIQTIINNCSSVEIGFVGLNKSCTERIIFSKNSGNSYTISDFVTSSSTINIRLAKMILNLTASGINISSNTTTQYNGTEYTVLNADDSDIQNNFIQLRYIAFKL